MPQTIDEGGLYPPNFNQVSPAFTLANNKWGEPDLGTVGGTVSYSFMDEGTQIRAHGEALFTNSHISQLSGYQDCFIPNIVAAFAAWSAISRINFVMVEDDGKPDQDFDTVAQIRIGAHKARNPNVVSTCFSSVT